MSRVGNSLTKSRDLGQDLVSRFRPHEGPWRVVRHREVLANGGFEGADASMGAALDLLLAQECEPTFDEIEPRSAGRREVQVKARMASKPASDTRRFVGPVIVEDQMHVELGRHLRVDGLEEAEELLAPMASMTLADDFASRDVEGGKQGRGAIAAVIVRPTFGRSERHRQNRRGPVQRLNLTLFVDTQDQRAIRRRQIKADNVAHFLDEQRVARELERLTPMRLQAERAPNAPNRHVTHVALFRQHARAPMCRVGWRPLQRVDNHLLHLRIRDPARRAGTRLVQQSIQAFGDEALPPASHRLPRDPQGGRHFGIRADRRHTRGQSAPVAQALAPWSVAAPTARASSAHWG